MKISKYLHYQIFLFLFLHLRMLLLCVGGLRRQANSIRPVRRCAIRRCFLWSSALSTDKLVRGSDSCLRVISWSTFWLHCVDNVVENEVHIENSKMWLSANVVKATNVAMDTFKKWKDMTSWPQLWREFPLFVRFV